jgi:hypothetical protein
MKVDDASAQRPRAEAGPDARAGDDSGSPLASMLGRRTVIKGGAVGALGALAGAALAPVRALADEGDGDFDLNFDPHMLDFSHVGALLNPQPLYREFGLERLDNGILHVAVRTFMPGCTGKMLYWWFLFRFNTEQYIWWHPVDHVSSNWVAGQPDTIIGSVDQIEEYFTGRGPFKITVQFRDPVEFFGSSAYTQALGSGAISAAICARGGQSWSPPTDPSGAVLGTRLTHVARDTTGGCVVRSHFWLGQDLPYLPNPVPPQQIAEIFPDDMGFGLLEHSFNEMTYLARFLPELYIAENRNTQPPALPW